MALAMSTLLSIYLSLNKSTYTFQTLLHSSTGMKEVYLLFEVQNMKTNRTSNILEKLLSRLPGGVYQKACRETCFNVVLLVNFSIRWISSISSNIFARKLSFEQNFGSFGQKLG